ncbi:MAG: SNF2 helicase associated domain-containing protein, partial [Candidatus Margulisbacteria bacterium]|nr:SNF2 helicase associated domain-containing protein [Candidatus Margulisiibacteriota bacterium]
MLDFFRELTRVKPNIFFTYDLRFEPLSVELRYDPEDVENVRDVPRERISLPEQLLLNILLMCPQKDGRYLVGKEYEEKALFYLHELLPGEVRLPPEKPWLRLRYALNLSDNNCRIVVDLSDTSFRFLRDVPKGRLPRAEKIFISFLAGVPVSSGCFYVNQKLLARLCYLLAKLDRRQIRGTDLNFCSTGPELRGVFREKKGRYEFLVQSGAEILRADNVKLLGEKNRVLLFENTIYQLDHFIAGMLDKYLTGGAIYLSRAEALQFSADCLPILAERGLPIELPDSLRALKNSVLTGPPAPALEIVKETGEILEIKLSYDYGLPVRAEYRTDNDSDFYEVRSGGQVYYLRRDKKSEDWLNVYLSDLHFTARQNRFFIEHDYFVDFMTYEFPNLRKNIGLQVLGERLEQFVYTDQTFNVGLTFTQSSGIDWFDFTPLYKVKDNVFTHAQIQELIADNKEYVRLNDGSLIKVPQREFAYLQSYLEGRSKKVAGDKYQVRKYDLYYLYSGVREQMSAQVDTSLQELLADLENFSGIAAAPLPDGVQGQPRPYQLHGFNWLHFLHRHNFHGVLADDMGLGKTLQVLLLLAGLKQAGRLERPALIVAPTSVVYNWVAEINKFTPDLKVLVLSGSRDRILKVKEAASHDIVITSYALLRNDLAHYSGQQFDYLVLDEAQYIKNPKTGIAKAVKCLQTRWRLALTGTPIENSLAELWSIFDFLMPGFLSSLNFFRALYSGEPERVRKKIHPFILRRAKAEVLTELPPKNEIDSFCELLPEQEALYLKVLQAQKKELLSALRATDINKMQLNILAGLLKLRQVCCHPALVKDERLIVESAKFNQFKELTAEILANGSKVIVFSQFVEMLSIMRKYLDGEKIRYAYLDGATKDRQQLIDNFNADTQTPLFLCSLKAGGVGINLTSANYVIIYDPWWNPAVEQQAMDRVYR